MMSHVKENSMKIMSSYMKHGRTALATGNKGCRSIFTKLTVIDDHLTKQLLSTTKLWP